MKGVIMSYMLVVMMMFVSLFMIWYIQFESMRSLLLTQFKTAFSITMLECTNLRCNEEEAINLMLENLEIDSTQFQGELSLLGYRNYPMLLRFQLDLKKQTGLWKDEFKMDRTMIEEEVKRDIP